MERETSLPFQRSSRYESRYCPSFRVASILITNTDHLFQIKLLSKPAEDSFTWDICFNILNIKGYVYY